LVCGVCVCFCQDNCGGRLSVNFSALNLKRGAALYSGDARLR
jgi:hypothetical protein